MVVLKLSCTGIMSVMPRLLHSNTASISNVASSEWMKLGDAPSCLVPVDAVQVLRYLHFTCFQPALRTIPLGHFILGIFLFISQYCISERSVVLKESHFVVSADRRHIRLIFVGLG